MGLFKRDFTPEEADDWGVQDTVAVVVSPVIYILLTIGPALSILLIPAGYIMVAAGVVLLVFLVKVINPKLDAVSLGYEKKQKGYLEDLERKVKWED